MSLLSDTDINALISPTSRQNFVETLQPGSWEDSSEKLLIYPFQDDLLSPVGYDLTVGEIYLSLSRKHKRSIEDGRPLSIQPGETVLVMTEEYLGMPKNKQYGGLIESKVSIVSKGISHISTTLDPDWEGRLLVALTNHQSYPIEIKRHTPFCTAMFLSNSRAATKPCGRPPQRKDIIEKHVDQWLVKPPLRKRLSPTVIPTVIILLFGIAGYFIFGVNEGWSVLVAVGIYIATILYPALV